MKTNNVLHGQQNFGGLGARNPPGLAHRDDALRQLRTDPGAVARLEVAIEGELQRRRTLFGGASEGTAQR